MLVGNIATLRPLFQRMLHLGSEDASHRSGATPKILSGAKLSHPYKSFDQEHELGGVGVGVKRDDNVMSTQIYGGETRGSTESEGGSQRGILEGGKQRIFVSQQVEISRS